MVSKDIGRVPVKDKEGRLIGIVDRDDVVRSLVNEREIIEQKSRNF